MRRLVPIAALIALLLPGIAAAQSPVITPAGDPSIRSDTIYALAGDSSQYTEESVLVLLDDGVVKLQADGRSTRTYRQVIQILREDAVESYSEHSLGWIPGRQTLRVNWFKVVGPDGKVISEKPAQVQDSDVPANMVDPVYSDSRIRRLSLAGVKQGTIVDWSYTVEDTVPFPPRDNSGSWSVSMGNTVRRSRLILDVPASLTPTIIEANLDFRRTEQTVGGRRVYTWAKADIPAVEPEPYMADSNGVYMHLDYALPRTWTDIGAWYASLSKDSYTLGPATRQKIAEVVAGARSRGDSLRALHRWVAQDIRYVSVSLGTGGYKPRVPDETVRTGFGDCKDKATLFIAALRDWKIAAHPVLLRNGRSDRRLPTIRQFDHAIAAVERPDGGYHYVDLTASYTPWGELPYAPQGEFAIVVRADGRVDEVTLPLDQVEKNRKTMNIVGELSPDGIFAGSYTETGTGLQQYTMRTTFESPLDSTQRAGILRSFPPRFMPGASGDSLAVTVGRNLDVRPRFEIHVRGARLAQRSGNTLILSLPMGTLESMGTIAEEIEARSPRRFPIDAEAVLGPIVTESETRITLPEGWRAQLPPTLHAKSVFGEFRSEYEQQGRVLVMRRKLGGARGVYPPERVGELTAWLREMAKETTRFIVLEPAG